MKIDPDLSLDLGKNSYYQSCTSVICMSQQLESLFLLFPAVAVTFPLQ